MEPNKNDYKIALNVVKSCKELIKDIDDISLEINNTFVYLTLPVGGKWWRISLLRKNALEAIASIKPLLKQYIDLTKQCEHLWVKGIYKEREPHL